MVHPIPRTRSWASFVRGAAVWTIVVTISQLLPTWFLVEHFGGGDRQFLLWPCFTGFSLVAFLAFGQIAASRMQGVSGVLDVRQSVTLTLTAPVASVVESIRESLKAIRATETQAVGERHVEIRARARGCSIRFTCTPNPDETLEIHIESEPRFASVLFDRGTNLEIVRRLSGAFWWREVRQRYAS